MYSLCMTFSKVESVRGRLLWEGQNGIKHRVLQANKPPPLLPVADNRPLTSRNGRGDRRRR
jgi:hypothetical protein